MCKKTDFWVFLKDSIYVILEKGKGRERNSNMPGIHQWVASLMPPAGNLAGAQAGIPTRIVPVTFQFPGQRSIL